MMERYTPQAQEALGLAVGVAETLNHGYVGTEHLLIGLLQEGTGVAAKVLEENGVEEDRVIELVSQLIAPNPTVQTADRTAYTPRARRVIENSYREAVPDRNRAHVECHAEGRGLRGQPSSQHHRGQYTEALHRPAGSHG